MTNRSAVRRLGRTLGKVFGIDSLRPGQEEVIRSVLAGQNTLAIMPTGAGKSLCYQLPALHLPGTTIVISPMIALMKDQVDKLGLRRHCVHPLKQQLGMTADAAPETLPA